MGKKLDKKAKAAVAKASKNAKAGKGIKKLRKLEGKLWTREYLLKIAEFDGATDCPRQRCRGPRGCYGHPCRRTSQAPDQQKVR